MLQFIMWFILALIAGFASSISSLATRKVYLTGNKDSWAFSFYYSAIGALVTFPFIFSDYKVATTTAPWLLMLFVGALIVVHNLLNFKAASFISPAIKGVIEKLRLAWIFILGLVILHEVYNPTKMIGTSLTLIAGVVLAVGIIYTQGKTTPKIKGVLFAGSATFIYALNIILYKFLFVDFSAKTLTFLIFLIPTVLNIILMPDFFKRTKEILKNHPVMLILSCVAGAISNLAMNSALAAGEVSKVIVVIESFLIITLIAEKMILREKDTFVSLLSKILALVFAISGAILIRLA